MSSISAENFERDYGGSLERLAKSFSHTSAIFSYREARTNALCYKVVNSREEEQSFLEERLAATKLVWPAQRLE